MSVSTPPLACVGWFFAILCFAALAAGVLPVALPLIALCGAAIVTLRADQVGLHSERAQAR